MTRTRLPRPDRQQRAHATNGGSLAPDTAPLGRTAQIACERHSGHCVYEPGTCPWCHVHPATITAPATRTYTRPGTDKQGRPITVTETRYLFGYGETLLGHFWRHALEDHRAEKAAARRTPKTPGAPA